MQLELIDRIVTADDGFVATITSTTGHTYQKAGARALFRAGDAFPVFGNLGSLCADQELLRHGAEAEKTGRPQRVRIDTTDETDALTGYGTACGGAMEVLIEPVQARSREIYRVLGERMRAGEETWLVHDLATGELTLAMEEPAPGDGTHVEHILPPRRAVILSLIHI